MALQVQTFTNVPAGKWAAFKAKIKADTGTEITNPSGTVTHGSFEFMYVYNEQSAVLTIQCLKKPLFISANVILKGLAEEIADLPSVAPPPPVPVHDPINGANPPVQVPESGTKAVV
jgi:hypothetical protein